MTTRYDEVNVRNGPGLNNLILFKILKKGYPLLVIEKFENWYRVIDFSDNKGWISKTQLSNDPFVIMISATIAASCAFMLPVATPPNAVVFGSGYLKIKDMVKNMLWYLNLEIGITHLPSMI